MADLMNCPECGKLFVKALRSVCNDCAKEEEVRFQLVYQFIRKRENRMATMEEVHEETEVSLKEITKFIREGRLQLANFPNMAYPCEKCNEAIREGRLCLSCRSELKSGLDSLEREKAFSTRRADQEKSKVRAYHLFDDKVRRK